MRLPVVLASDVLVDALAAVDPDVVSFPQVPPFRGRGCQDVLGVFVRPTTDFGLVLSAEVLEQTSVALESLGWSFDQRDRASGVLLNMVGVSGGCLVSSGPAGLQLPQVSEIAAAALRAACSAQLGPPSVRAVITMDPSGLQLRGCRPRGIPWPADTEIFVADPVFFRQQVEAAFRRRGSR